MYVSRVGFQLAGTATYSTFTLRAGAEGFTALSKRWDQNLPDQRVQFDSANVPVAS